ncbi:MAG: tRNA (adenosine(37)-N6)-threonylcarbamoyltransferase complex transferase subunit TsaD [Spirochaetota bacterium]
MRVLGIETSCDETSASVVEDGTVILSNVTATQEEFHRKYAGVVPEIASRRHHRTINYVIEQCLQEAGLGFGDLDAVAVTAYPGLIGSLLVGVTAAKTLSFALGIPLLGVNHIEAHLYSVQFENRVRHPLVGLIISGGHTLLVRAEGVGGYEILGSTLDDAVGEAFDKVSKHLGLGYPGGPAIERAAEQGDERAYDFPRVTLNGGTDRYNFSYSGLKNAVINQRKRFRARPGEETVADVAASFQAAATDVLLTKARWACGDSGINRVALAGGVANNTRVRELFRADTSLEVYLPSRSLTTDNAAMVAGLAYHKLARGERSHLDLEPRSRLAGITRGKRSVHEH